MTIILVMAAKVRKKQERIKINFKKKRFFFRYYRFFYLSLQIDKVCVREMQTNNGCMSRAENANYES